MGDGAAAIELQTAAAADCGFIVWCVWGEQLSLRDKRTMTPQWRGLVNGTIVYLVLGAIAMGCRMMINKTNQP